MHDPEPVTAEEAAKILDVPVAMIWSWKHREKVTPKVILDVHQRGTRHVPLYVVDELRHLADAWHQRRARKS